MFRKEHALMKMHLMQGRKGKKFFYINCHSRLHEHIHACFMQAAGEKNSQDLINFTSLLQAEISLLLDPDHYVHWPSLHKDLPKKIFCGNSGLCFFIQSEIWYNLHSAWIQLPGEQEELSENIGEEEKRGESS